MSDEFFPSKMINHPRKKLNEFNLNRVFSVVIFFEVAESLYCNQY